MNLQQSTDSRTLPLTVDWLSNGIRIEWKRGLPGWAGFLGGGYVGIGHSGPGTLMHESMHGFWGTWDGWQETCDRMNFYTFKRDQAQFILDFREYDRSGQPNPWEAWRPYYKYLLGVLKSDISEGVSFWEALEDRAFYKIGGFYHQQETIFPAHAARKLSLVPPPLQKYFRGFLEEGENRTWAEELDWYSRLEAPDHHLWNLGLRYERPPLAFAGVGRSGLGSPDSDSRAIERYAQNGRPPASGRFR